MNKETINMLLDRQREDIKSFVKLFIEEVKNEVGELKKENDDVKRSLEFTQDLLETANSVIKDQQQRIEKLEAVHANSDGVSERLRTLEDYSRRNNIIEDGVMEEDGETTEKLQRDIEKLFSEKLDLKPAIDNIHRLGSKFNKRDTRSRSVIVKLTRFQDRQNCLKRSRLLRGTNVYINEDVCRTTADIRKQKLEELKIKRSQGYIAYFSGVNIIVKNRKPHEPTDKRDGQRGPHEPADKGNGQRSYQAAMTLQDKEDLLYGTGAQQRQTRQNKQTVS